MLAEDVSGLHTSLVNLSVQPMSQAPYVLSLLVCDSVIFDRATNKPTIVGCFSSIGSLQFPAFHPGMMVFAELADGRGESIITFRLVDVDEETVLFEASVPYPFTDPLVVAQLVFQVPAVMFPEPGEYRLQLNASDEPLMERRIVLFQIGGPGYGPEQPGDGRNAE